LSVKQYLKLTISSHIEKGILFMKITVKQLKQLIREQVEEITFSGYGGGSQIEPKREPNYSSAFTHDVMLGGLGSETPAGENVEYMEEEWADWVKANKAELARLLRTKHNVEKNDLATALKRAKEAFFKQGSYDPDLMGRAVDIEDVLPEYEAYFEKERWG